VYPEKSVCLVKTIGDGVIPCAIPYMIHSMADPNQNRMGDMPLEKAGVEIVVDQVTALDTERSNCTLASGQVISYERLVLATGSRPVLPPVPGIDKNGTFTIEKSLSAMMTLREAARKAKNVVILGGGFIGVEFAD
jgi:NADH dehydrogenase FAD-containing subunit